MVRLTAIHLERFRNHAVLALNDFDQTTVLAGLNGAGKTNVLEAVDLVISGTSFRRASTADVIAWGSDLATIRLGVEQDGWSATVEERISAEGERRLFVGGQEARRRSDALGRVHTVVFTPDDLDLVRGPAEVRRDALDALGGRLSDSYRKTRREYMRVVRHRNVLFREWKTSASDIEVWTQQAVELGARLLVRRRRLAARLLSYMVPEHTGLSGGHLLTGEYHDRCGLGLVDPATEVALDEARKTLVASFVARAAEEKIRSTTLVGPHRDDLILLLDGRDARRFASQGQQRSIALAWRIAEMRVIAEMSGRKPILLFDDVMSELDAARREALAVCMEEAAQAIVTTTDASHVPCTGGGRRTLYVGTSGE